MGGETTSGTTLSSRHTSAQFLGAGGVRLLLQAWLPAGPDPTDPPEPSAVIAVVHGYGDHGGRYLWFGEAMASRGYAVYVYDLRGHGQSSGARGQVKRFDEYLDDTAVYLDEVRRLQPGKPLFLLGHSLGGLICARFAEERAPDVHGLVLSSPFLQPADAAPPSRVAVIKGLALVWPNKDIGNTVQAEQLSHDPAVVKAYVTDRLVHHVAPARWAVELLAAQEAAMAGAESVTLPLLVLYGRDDQVVDVAFIETLFSRAGSQDKTIERYEGLYHECFNETERERVYADLAAWLAPRVAAGAAG